MRYSGEIFELGSGVNYSINELADVFGCKKQYISSRPGEYDKTLCDYSKAEKMLEYKPKGNLKKYIEKWVEENPKINLKTKIKKWFGEKKNV